MGKRDRISFQFARNCNKSRYFCGLILATIIPLSAIAIIKPKPSIAREIRVENTVIYVDSQKGNDSNQGTRNTPLKTISKALQIARSNTIISLSPGTYSEASGETFPLILKNNITIKGLSGGQGHSVVIKGNGSFLSHSAAEQNVTIAAIRNAGSIIGVTVTNPHNRGHGLWIESANPQVADSTFTRSGNTGLSVNGNSKPIITNNYFFNNGGNGLLVYGTSSPKITNNLFENTGFGVSIVQNSMPILENNIFKGNRIGIILEGSSQGIFRNNTVTNSLEYGLVAITKSKVDLGVANNLGNNTFSNNRKLDIQNITANIMSATGTTVNGQTAGKIDFSNNAISVVASNEVVTQNSNTAENTANNNFSRLRTNPLPPKDRQERTTTTNRLPPSASNPPVTEGETLPPPPPIANLTAQNTSQGTSKQYVFSAPQDNEVNNKVAAQNVIQASSLSNNRSSSNIDSLSDLLTASAIKYRVLVEATDSNQQTRVKSLYPDAFKTTYKGKLMLQIGAFSDRSKAEVASRSLANLGLNSHILE